MDREVWETNEGSSRHYFPFRRGMGLPRREIHEPDASYLVRRWRASIAKSRSAVGFSLFVSLARTHRAGEHSMHRSRGTRGHHGICNPSSQLMNSPLRSGVISLISCNTRLAPIDASTAPSTSQTCSYFFVMPVLLNPG